jgi:hypothetical protein
MKKVCLERYQQFGTAGNASKIKQLSWMTLLLNTPKAN